MRRAGRSRRRPHDDERRPRRLVEDAHAELGDALARAAPPRARAVDRLGDVAARGLAVAGRDDGANQTSHVNLKFAA